MLWVVLHAARVSSQLWRSHIHQGPMVLLYLLNHPRVVGKEWLHCRRPQRVPMVATRHEGRGRRPRRRDIPSLALWTPSRILSQGRSRSSRWTTFSAAARLVFVLRILTLVPGLFFLCKTLPIVLDLLSLFTPQLTNDFGDLRVCQAGILEDHTGLVMLAVKDEGCSQENQKLLHISQR